MPPIPSSTAPAAQQVANVGRSRSPNLDLIRAVAVFFVLSSHFMLNNGFYERPVAGIRMYIMVLMRYFFVTCVPLFLLLTGYLSGNKKPEWAYFRKLGHTLVLYSMASVTCLLFSRFYLGEDFTLMQGILRIFNFSASNYAWYVEMYIGLFLLSPFLNSMYHGLTEKRHKQLLLLILILITCAPSVFNVIDLTKPGILNKFTSTDYSQLVPAFWKLYPIQYYMIGMYLREYGWNISLRRCAMFIVAAAVVFTGYNIFRRYQVPFLSGSPWLGRSSLQNLIISVLVFGFLLKMPLERTPKWLSAMIQKISQLSFLI